MTPAKNLNDIFVFDDNEFEYDSEVLISTIVSRGGTFEPLYMEPDYFYYMAGQFWARYKDSFYKWFEVLNMEYNPIENYDRNEQWHDDTTDDNTIKYTGTVENDGTNTLETDISAFDSNSYQPHNKDTNTIDTTDTRDLTDKIDNDRDFDHKGRIHGNIGVTTSQQMIESELKLRYWNVYEHIADIFINDMLVSVY